ncbi:hypothetical protein MKW92_024388 [Papaver armeniacum]|nr:hypothetical protein MKW92_004874 [Papaver armeniacum]KAI3957308.1 hypothetical protein MKW92_024388 [Papaver armeniacum]
MEENSETQNSTEHLPKSDDEFDPKTMRKTKPGTKRLIMILTVLSSFILGFPFLLKTIEIYRSPLPFHDIDSLSSTLQSNPLHIPCRFQVIYLGFDAENFLDAHKLGFMISEQMAKLTGGDPVCGGCGKDYTVSVTVDSSNVCNQHLNGGDSCFWRCGMIDLSVNLNGNDEGVDEMFHSILSRNENCESSGGKVYSVVVVNNADDDVDGVRVVVGKYRHAWLVGKVEEMGAVSSIANVFVKFFMNGGKEEGILINEFMPVGADGRVVLSFSLLNANPQDWIYDWDFRKIDEDLLAPVVEALAPIANVTVESQVLYHTPKSSFSYWDTKLSSYVFRTKDLPFFMWGGVIVWNPPRCFRSSKSMQLQKHMLTSEDLEGLLEVSLGQLRQLFGLKSNNLYVGESGMSSVLSSERGFTEWELDALSRQHTCFNLHSCAKYLGLMVQSLPRMIIKDEIGKQVKFSLEAANLAQTNASCGVYEASAVSSRQARALAEDAFFHPSIMSISYYSFEHCFAVYTPFFLPVALHVLLASAKEWRRYKQERKKYFTWISKTKAE